MDQSTARTTPWLDPTGERPISRPMAPRPREVRGKVVGLLDISKPQGAYFLDRIEELLRERCDPQAIIRQTKPTFSRPAPPELRQGMVQDCQLLIEALAD